jgi:hypothetical protein
VHAKTVASILVLITKSKVCPAYFIHVNSFVPFRLLFFDYESHFFSPRPSNASYRGCILPQDGKQLLWLRTSLTPPLVLSIRSNSVNDSGALNEFEVVTNQGIELYFRKVSFPADSFCRDILFEVWR